MNFDDFISNEDESDQTQDWGKRLSSTIGREVLLDGGFTAFIAASPTNPDGPPELFLVTPHAVVLASSPTRSWDSYDRWNIRRWVNVSIKASSPWDDPK